MDSQARTTEGVALLALAGRGLNLYTPGAHIALRQKAFTSDQVFHNPRKPLKSQANQCFLSLTVSVATGKGRNPDESTQESLNEWLSWMMVRKYSNDSFACRKDSGVYNSSTFFIATL